MMPFGPEAAACSMIRAMSPKSPVGGLRYSTSTSICSPASAMPFLMVFHQLSLSGAWLTSTYLRLSPWPSATAVSGAAKSAAPIASDLITVFMRSSQTFLFFCVSRYSRQQRNLTIPLFRLQPVAKIVFTFSFPKHITS